MDYIFLLFVVYRFRTEKIHSKYLKYDCESFETITPIVIPIFFLPEMASIHLVDLEYDE